MVRTDDWKYVHHEAFRPELFDLNIDPEELNDLGEDPAHENIREQMRACMFESLRKRKTQTTFTDKQMEKRARGSLNREIVRSVKYGTW
jgi:arylsulfatase A-like enzyme